MSSPPVRKILSIYERTRIISLRAAALANGAPTTLPVEQKLPTSAIDIAKMELEAGVVPFRIVRTHPDGHKETVDVNMYK